MLTNTEDINQHLPKYLVLKQNLLKIIQDLKPGDKIPSYNDIIAKYHVNRAIINRCMLELSNEGWIISKRGEGTVVAQPEEREEPTTDVKSVGIFYDYSTSFINQQMLNSFIESVSGSGLSLQLNNYRYLKGFTFNKGKFETIRANDDLAYLVFAPNETREKVSRFLDSLTDFGKPVLVIDWPADDSLGDNVYVLCNDNKRTGELAAEELIKTGAKNFSVINAEPDHPNVIARIEGFVATLAKNGINIEKNNFLDAELQFGHLSAREHVYKYLLKQSDAIRNTDAAFCVSDMTALIFYRVCFELGISVPDDISIIGVDNAFFSEYMTPGLTTIDHGIDNMGELVRKFLLDIQKDKAPSSRMLDTGIRLVERGSIKKVN